MASQPFSRTMPSNPPTPPPFFTPQEDNLLISLLKAAVDNGSTLQEMSWGMITEQMDRGARDGGFFIAKYWPASLEARWKKFLRMRRNPWSMCGIDDRYDQPAAPVDLPNIGEVGRIPIHSGILNELPPLRNGIQSAQPFIRALERTPRAEGPPRSFDEARVSRSRGNSVSGAR